MREKLAKALKVGWIRGMYLQDMTEQWVGERRTYWKQGNPPDYMVAEVIVHTSQGAVKHPVTGMTALPNTLRTFNAYPGRQPLHPVLIYPKTDQEFEKYATPWELQFSNLVYPYNGGFTPVMDESYRVIGHKGEVLREHLRVPSASRRSWAAKSRFPPTSCRF